MIALSDEARWALVAERKHKRPWYEVAPKDATDIGLPHPDIWGPLSEEGGECLWPWEPQQLVGLPLGQYHCVYCLSMCVAGQPHPDYTPGWGDPQEPA